ncbi:hypothetical protein [Actinokineospora sp. UTMC 2448]|uniref:hypothetical protein n=1 Tax=Actinokineospora sp. UTMC 2448 TaxID=2268449 RepID=UPI00216451DB|nr:hypothetical protein [Actinokineospora sp. UTMC 2448]UVS78373.1 hypothetical protein Actkin_02106 [Actinokineospora sp. UTMC 2448]
MWRIGFRLWSAGRYLKYGGGGLLLLALVWMGTGFSALFWIVALVVGAVLYGARSALTGVAAREGDRARLPGRPR